KYLDQGSRNISDQLKSAKEAVTYWRGVGDADKIAKAERSLATIQKMDEHGSRNYVVFDDKLVNIENKYAMGGLVRGYADGGLTTDAYNNDPDVITDSTGSRVIRGGWANTAALER